MIWIWMLSGVLLLAVVYFLVTSQGDGEQCGAEAARIPLREDQVDLSVRSVLTRVETSGDAQVSEPAREPDPDRRTSE